MEPGINTGTVKLFSKILHLDDANLVGDIKGVIISCQADIRLLLSIWSASTPCLVSIRESN